MSDTPAPKRSPAEELANGVASALGVVLSAVGLAVMVGRSWKHGTAVHVASAAVFGCSLLASYSASACYHLAKNAERKEFLRQIDHAAIFLLIAGTYTPFTLVTLHGSWGWSIFGAVWGLALFGLLFEKALRRHWRGLSLGLYLLMGWTAVVAIKPLSAALPHGGFVLLIAGGLAYTSGTVLYALHRVPFAHFCWHLVVLTGSALHFFAVLLYVIPR
ncbi:MAG TPA: hemolysin III family protein [Candidatus Methanoperedens sp.]|nr:hemolysin III family protein [Candidatus Methanoperedens sp.]